MTSDDLYVARYAFCLHPARLACKCSPRRPLPYRYANCFRGNSEFNVHAEEFLLEDQALITALDGLEGAEHPKLGRCSASEEGVEPPKVLTTAAGPAAELAAELTLFMTYQPCHHSGGNVPRGDHARAMYAEHPCERSPRRPCTTHGAARGMQALSTAPGAPLPN
jgi:hypothetical protein